MREYIVIDIDDDDAAFILSINEPVSIGDVIIEGNDEYKVRGKKILTGGGEPADEKVILHVELVTEDDEDDEDEDLIMQEAEDMIDIVSDVPTEDSYGHLVDSYDDYFDRLCN